MMEEEKKKAKKSQEELDKKAKLKHGLFFKALISVYKAVFSQ